MNRRHVFVATCVGCLVIGLSGMAVLQSAAASVRAEAVHRSSPYLATTNSPFLGTYTSHQKFGSFVATGTLTVRPMGIASDGSALDIASWTASRGTISVTIGNDAGEVVVWIGRYTHYGIASIQHPGTAKLYVHGGLVETGTFYAQRLSRS